MTPNRKSLWALGSLALVGLIADQLVKPIWDVETQDLWKDKVKPYLVAHASGWVALMIDWLGPFWSGVAVTLLALLVIEVVSSGWRRLSRSGAEGAKPETPALMDLGRECIAIADETLRTQQQIDDAAPKLPRPEDGYRDQEHWSRVQFNHAMEAHEYQRRSMMHRDRQHGADLVDALFRLREAGLTIPMFADAPSGSTDEMLALLVPHYLAAYARFVGAMGRFLKRGDLDGAKRSAANYRAVTERGGVPIKQ